MLIAETDRLNIRSWEVSDEAHYLKMSKDIGYNCFAPPGYYLVKNAEECQEKIRQRMLLFESRGLGKFPIFLKSTGEFLGTCGMDPYKVHGKEELELGYRLCLTHWRKGYATEASQAVLRYGFDRLALKRIIAFAAPQNQASLKVIQKLGFKYTGTFMHADVQHELYELTGFTLQ